MINNKIANNNIPLRIVMALIGSLLFAASIQTMIALGSGLSPVDVMSQSIQQIFNITNFGIAVMLFHSFFGFLLLVFKKKLELSWLDLLLSALGALVIGLSLHITAGLISFNVAFFSLIGILIFDIAFFFFALSIYIIMKSNIIITPYEKFSVEISNKFNLKLGKVRLFIDIILIMLAFILFLLLNRNIDFSFVTVLIALLTGFYISLFELIRKKISRSEKGD